MLSVSLIGYVGSNDTVLELYRYSYSPSPIIQIGSPRTNMDLLADNVFFLRAYIPKKYWFVNVNVQDPVSGIGSWGFKSPARSELMLLDPALDNLIDLHASY